VLQKLGALLHSKRLLDIERAQREYAEAREARERDRRMLAEEALRAVQGNESGAPSGSRPWPLLRFLRTNLRQLTSKPGELLSLLTLVGATLYAFTWTLYSDFFKAFGLAPEEVGITYVRVVVRVGVVMAAGALVILIAVFLDRIFWIDNRQQLSDTEYERSATTRKALIAFALFLSFVRLLEVAFIVVPDPLLLLVTLAIAIWWFARRFFPARTLAFQHWLYLDLTRSKQPRLVLIPSNSVACSKT
jgi:hypothetical protein